MDCEEVIYSEDYYDLIISYSSIDMQKVVVLPDCRQKISID